MCVALSKAKSKPSEADGILRGAALLDGLALVMGVIAFGTAAAK